MIKVNLIPEEQRRKARKVRFKRPTLRIPKFDLVFSIVCLVLAIGLSWWLSNSAEKELQSLNDKIKDTQEQLKELNKEKEMVENIESRQKELREWISLVENLNKGRSLYFHLMDEINKIKPEYMWLVLFEENNMRFKLNGKTFSNHLISNFMDNLNASPYFADVKLDEITESPEKEHSVFGFQLSGTVVSGGEN